MKRTIYLLIWNHRWYVSTNGMEMARFADWLGAETRIRQFYNCSQYIPNIERYA